MLHSIQRKIQFAVRLSVLNTLSAQEKRRFSSEASQCSWKGGRCSRGSGTAVGGTGAEGGVLCSFPAAGGRTRAVQCGQTRRSDARVLFVENLIPFDTI